MKPIAPCAPKRRGGRPAAGAGTHDAGPLPGPDARVDRWRRTLGAAPVAPPARPSSGDGNRLPLLPPTPPAVRRGRRRRQPGRRRPGGGSRGRRCGRSAAALRRRRRQGVQRCNGCIGASAAMIGAGARCRLCDRCDECAVEAVPRQPPPPPRVGARRLCGDVWGTAWGPGPGPRAVLPRLRLGSTAVGDRLNFDL